MVFIPINSPRVFTKAPPLFPGFTAASVWMKDWSPSFAKFLAFGITFGLAFQAILNLMVVVGLIPVTGVTLPFLSYGGSSLLITLISMGVLLNISRYQR